MSSTFSDQQAQPNTHKSEMPTASDMRKAIIEGVATPSEILEACLEAVDQHEEDVGAWAFLDRDGARPS